MEKYRIGIIGCGLIGNKRAGVLKNFKNSKLLIVADPAVDKAKSLASSYNCKYTADWREVATNKDVNIVIVAVVHNMLAEITIECIKNGKNVLLEKPGGKNASDIKKIIDEYEKIKLQKKRACPKITVGFNHRFHPAFDKAKELIKTENIGDIMFIRSVYGHGGRLGYDKEWRASKEISGGGELLDQGSHIIDLSRYFLGDLSVVYGFCDTFFWNMDVEDNCFALLKNNHGQISQFHVSWTHWKNSFSFDIFCKTGQISISGLGKSYGKEKLTFYKMKPEMGPPEVFVYEFDDIDRSWEKQYNNFIYSIENNTEPNGNIYDAYESMKIVEGIYKLNDDNHK